MKRKIISLVLLLSLLVSCAAGGDGETATTDEKKEPEMKYNDASIEKSKAFLDGLIENDLFVSFEIGDESFPKDVDKWQKTIENGENTYKITYLSTDGVKLTVDVDYDGEYSSIYWVCNFENGGDGNSRVIKDVKPLSFTYTLEGVTLRTSNGSSNRADDFEIIDNDLKNRASYSSEGGRSSSGGFPYFDL
ncbi:MAG: hypothetical protein MJ072_05415 [Clostridia bacterium]|nr:hypothetical protein [Clostridia bacterium]